MEENFMAPLDITLLSIPKGQKEAQGFVERSHRTDDEEFYIPTLPYITYRKIFMISATNWVIYYNLKRSHGGREMDGKTPKEKIYELSLASSKAATSISPLLLDRVSPFIFELVGANHTDWDFRHSLYHVIRKQTMAPYTN